MQIISHRGFWKTKEEQNSKSAFERAFRYNFGIETDIRDCGGKLVISHDIPDGSEMTVDNFFSLYNSLKSNVYLALNIKSDGLYKLLGQLITQYAIKNYFVFDMSVPDSIGYCSQSMNLFMRQSELESVSLYHQATGVWMDSFELEWIKDSDIISHLENKKKVCVVSPELHNRSYDLVWKKYNNPMLIKDPNFMVCTDYPDKFRSLIKA